MSVYIDTSAILAILDLQDPRHESAADVWTALMRSDEKLLTSNYVLLETIALLHSRFGIPTVRQFVDRVVPAMTVVWVNESLHDLALTSVLAGAGKSGPSLVDCVTIATVRERRIERLFAYDKHFANIGCVMLG